MKNIVLITGGSSGLGFEIAKKHLVMGDNVCIIGRNKDRLESARNNLRQISSRGDVLALTCNVSSEDDVRELHNHLAANGYELSFTYNSAGIGLYGHHENVTREMIDKLFEANLIGLILVSTYSTKAMKTKGGVIVNIMSSAAKKGNATESVYCAAKWGARGYTEALQAALKGTNIKILAVYPGGMDTAFWQHDTGQNPDTSKFMNPSEVAETIVVAASKKDSLFVSEIVIERK